MRYYIATLFIIVILCITWLVYTYPDQIRMTFSMIENISSQLAAVIVSHNPKTIADIQGDYNATGQSVATFTTTATSTASISQKKVRILLVPGHQPDYGGAEYMSPYGDIKERDLVVELADDLQTFSSRE
jgi:hypothetical protein